MIADISQINLSSKFFAELLKAPSKIKELKEGIVYVKTDNNGDWKEAVNKVKESFANNSMRGSWLMKYDVDALPEDLCLNDESIVSKMLGTKHNLITSVFLPDRMEQYYIVGAIPNKEYLEAAAAFMTADIQNLIEACLPFALSNMEVSRLENLTKGIYEGKINNAWADEVKRINDKRQVSPSFRGYASVNPLSTLGDAAANEAEKIKKGDISYKDRQKLILSIDSIVKKIQSSDEKVREEGKIEFARAYHVMSERERVLLAFGMLEVAKPKTLKNIAGKLDRDKLGAQTKYRIVIKKWESQFRKDFDLKDHYKNCLFISQEDKIYPVKMNKSSLVIYTLSLIEKVTKNKKDAIVDIKANNKAFIETYRFLFNDYRTDTTQKLYDELFKRNKDKPEAPIRSGRLTENYNDIEAALADTFKNLDEDYSPFLANSTTPLAINANKIELPAELMAIKIR